MVEGRGPIDWGDRVDWEGTMLLTEAAMQCLYHQTLNNNMAKRDSYACMYGGKLMVTTINSNM